MTTPPPIAILRSVIAPEAISQYLEKELGFVQVKCRFLHHGFNDTYEAESNGRPFIVRLYRHGWRSAKEVEAECRILSELAQAGVSVSTPFAGPAGGFQFSLPAIEEFTQQKETEEKPDATEPAKFFLFSFSCRASG